MTKSKAWSYSALTSYETCPLRHYLTRISKEVKEPEGEALVWGNKVHKALELALTGEKELPSDLEHHAPLVDMIANRDGVMLVEQQLAITEDFEPTKWFAKNVWARCVVDVAVLNGDTAVILDWKTGKMKPASDQLKLFALFAFICYPDINRADTGFVWLKDRKTTRAVYTRDQEAELWQEFTPRVNKYFSSIDNNKWPKRPSGLCRRWCPVGKDNCEHCGD